MDRVGTFQSFGHTPSPSLHTAEIPPTNGKTGAMSPRVVVPIAVLFISFSAIFIRLSTAPPLAIATYRMAFSTLFLLPLFLFGAPAPAPADEEPTVGMERSPAGPRRPTGAAKKRHGSLGGVFASLSGIRRGDLLLCIASGAFLALHFATWIASVDMTSIASSTVLVNLQPIFVLAAGALVLGEKSSRASVLFVGITIVGCAVLSFGDARVGTHHLFGDGLAFLGAVFVAGYMIIGRLVRQRLTARAYTLIVYSASTVGLLVLDLITGTPLWPFPLTDWLLFAALAVFCTLLGHSLLNWALKYVKASVVATSVLGEPVIASLLAVPFFGEIPSPLGATGAIITIVGLYFFVRSERADARQTP